MAKWVHCVKCVLIRSYPGPHFPAFGLNISPYLVRMRENADQNNSEYGHFLRSDYNQLILDHLSTGLLVSNTLKE